MSKGSNRRPGNREAFNSNFDRIKWSGESRYTNRKPKAQDRKGPYVMGDIEPYIAVGGDMAGKPITSRSRHREFLNRNKFTEVGNEKEYFFKHNGKSPDNPWVKWRDDGD